MVGEFPGFAGLLWGWYNIPSCSKSCAWVLVIWLVLGCGLGIVAFVVFVLAVRLVCLSLLGFLVC